ALNCRSMRPARALRNDLATLASLELRDPRLHDLLDQRDGESLVVPELDRSLAGGTWPELLAVVLDHLLAHREQAVVILERRVADQPAVPELERRHRVADPLGRIGRGGPDRGAELVEGGSLLRGKAGQVLLDAGDLLHRLSRRRAEAARSCGAP